MNGAIYVLLVVLAALNCRATADSPKEYLCDLTVNVKDGEFRLPLLCNSEGRYLYRSPEYGVVIDKVLVDGKPIRDEPVFTIDLDVQKLEKSKKWISYEIPPGGVTFSKVDSRTGKSSTYWYGFGDFEKSIEIVYRARLGEKEYGTPNRVRFIFGPNYRQSLLDAPRDMLNQ